ncbi:MAG: TonB-dependent receptor, partial [Myxococcota bacterium]|nr:TonB-dependent receptor [Myxococcota bacterium]
SNKVLVLLDGRSVYVDLLGTVYWGQLPVSLEEIERIEVIRGPGSAIYGANAMTGVINIITLPPEDADDRFKVEGGSPGYAQGSVVTHGTHRSTAYRFSAGYHQTGRWSAESLVPEDGPMVVHGADPDLSLQVFRTNARLDHSFMEWGMLSLSGGYAQGYNEFYALGALGDFVMDFQNSYGRMDVGFGPVHLRTFYSSLVGATYPWSSYEGAREVGGTIDNDTIDGELEGYHTFQTGPVDHRVLAGVGVRSKRIAFAMLEEGGEPISEQHYSAFVQEEARVDPVRMVGSLRVDRHPLVELKRTVSPRGAAVIRIRPETSMRASVGTSFRAPSHIESYTDFALPSTADAVYIDVLGDRELVPESVRSFELGLHDESTGWYRADAAVFLNEVRDLIFVGEKEDTSALSYNPDSNGFSAGEIRFTNLGSEWVGYGLELDGRVFPVDGVELLGNLNWQRITEDDGDQVLVDASTSELKLNLGLSYRAPWQMDLSVRGHYVSPQTWRLREYDEIGNLVDHEESIDARTIGVARVASRMLFGSSSELAVTAWNIAGLLGAEPFSEHPKGQEVGSR